jgi:hypothetical protein
MTEQFNLCFQNLKVAAPVAARLVPGQGVIHLVFAGEDHRPWHSYSAPAEEMAGILAELLAQARAMVAGHNPLSESCSPPAPLTPQGEAKTSYTPAQVPRPRSAITAEDMRGLDDEAALSLLIERFRNSDAKIYTALLADYYTQTKKHYKGTSEADLEVGDGDEELAASSLPLPVPAPRVPSQLRRDLEMIRPRLGEVIQNGQFVKGHQSRIAEILHITNSGVTNRERIKGVERILLKKLVSSSSSSTAEKPADVDPGAIRAA